MKLMTDDEIGEICGDETLDTKYRYARAIERIATQRALEAAAEVAANQANDMASGAYNEGCNDVAIAIRAMAKELT